MVLFVGKKTKKKDIDILKHFKRIILKSLKPIVDVLSDQVRYLGTFSRVMPDILGYNTISSINKVYLLYRLEKPERVRQEIVKQILDLLRVVEADVDASSAPLGLKAYALSIVVLSQILLDEHEPGLELFEKVVSMVNNIQDILHRSIVLSDVLFNLGSIRRYVRRKFIEIPEEVINGLASQVSDSVQRIISEASLINDAYIRGRIFASIGFGTRLFGVISKEEIMAQWYDVNQSQRLALDAIDEAEKIGDWYKKGVVLADAATVLAISGEDTTNLAEQKFDEATELAFRFLKKNPMRAARLIGRIAYDKAFTKFYMDSDKFFYESIIIPLEVGGLEEALPVIMRNLRLASKARYFYVVYEVVKDWLLPLADKENDLLRKAKFLSICSHMAIPISISWASAIAREAVSIVKNIINSELLPMLYDTIFVGDPLVYIYSILRVIPIFANIAFSIPKETAEFLYRILGMTENFTKIYIRVFRRNIGRHLKEVLNFSHELGVLAAHFRDLPRIYEEVVNIAEQFAYSARRVLASACIDPLEQYLPCVYFLYGLSQRMSSYVLEKAKNIMMELFEFQNNMWVPKDEKIIQKLARRKQHLETFSEILRILGEIMLRTQKPIRDTYLKILTDLSELLDQRIYAGLFLRVIEKIENKEVSKQLLTRVFNVLIDEGKITRDLVTRRFYKVINAIDPILAKFIVEEVSG